MNRIIASGVLVSGAACALLAVRQLSRVGRAMDAATALQVKRAGGLHLEHIRPPQYAAALPPEDPHAPPSPRLQLS